MDQSSQTHGLSKFPERGRAAVVRKHWLLSQVGYRTRHHPNVGTNQDSQCSLFCPIGLCSPPNRFFCGNMTLFPPANHVDYISSAIRNRVSSSSSSQRWADKMPKLVSRGAEKRRRTWQKRGGGSGQASVSPSPQGYFLFFGLKIKHLDVVSGTDLTVKMCQNSKHNLLNFCQKNNRDCCLFCIIS